jgi:hypothetical protein
MRLRNEYPEYFLAGKGGQCVRLIILPPSCADCHEIWEPQPPGTLKARAGLYSECLYEVALYYFSHVSNYYYRRILTTYYKKGLR